MKSHNTQGTLFAVASAAFLSTTSIFIRYLTQTYHIPALILAMWRDIFVVITLLPVLFLVKGSLWEVKRKHLLYLAGYGFVLALFNSFWTLSVAVNGAAVATVLVYSSAGFTAVLGWWFLKENLGWSKIGAVIFSLAGCGLVSGAFEPGAWKVNPSGVFIGLATGIIAGVCYALYSLLGRSASQRGLNPWTTLLYTFIFATFFLVVINLLSGGMIPGAAANPADFLWLGKAWAGWEVLFLLAAVPTLAGFGLYNVSLSYLPSSVVNLIATTEPAFTAVTAYIFLGESLRPIQIMGSVVILGSVAFLRIYEGWSNGRAQPAITNA